MGLSILVVHFTLGMSGGFLGVTRWSVFVRHLRVGPRQEFINHDANPASSERSENTGHGWCLTQSPSS